MSGEKAVIIIEAYIKLNYIPANFNTITIQIKKTIKIDLLKEMKIPAQ